MTTITLKFDTAPPPEGSGENWGEEGYEFETGAAFDAIADPIDRWRIRELWNRFKYEDGRTRDEVKGFAYGFNIHFAFAFDGALSDGYIQEISVRLMLKEDYAEDMAAIEVLFERFLSAPYKQIIIPSSHPYTGLYNVITKEENAEPEYESGIKKYKITFYETTLREVT